MSTNVTWPVIGGSTYAIPASGEVNWPTLSNYLIAIAGAQGTTSQLTAIRQATSTPVTVVSASDCVIVCKLGSPAAVAVNLPAGVNGQYYVIVDGTGDAATNNITITPNGAETINGAATYVINGNRGGVILFYQTTQKWTVVASFGVATAFTVGATGATGSTLAVNGKVAPTVGVQFAATQVASADANCLDDYEEGTWTPTFTGSTGSAGAVAFTSSGTYTKVGRLVVCVGKILMSNKGSWGGKMLMTGLPFSPPASTFPAVSVAYFVNYTTSVVFLSGYINGAGGQIVFTQLTAAAASTTDSNVSDWSATTEVAFTTSFFV